MMAFFYFILLYHSDHHGGDHGEEHENEHFEPDYEDNDGHHDEGFHGGGGGGGALTCSASLNAAGNPLITWTQVNGVGEYQVRDNDGWVATQTDDRYVDTNPTNGSRTYEIRYRIAGQVFDTTCTPTVNVN